MNKKKSIAIFTIACILLVLGMVFAFVPTFPIGKSMYDYTGYARSIKLGLDLAGGVSAVFDVKAPDGETLTTDELKTRLDGVKASMEDLLTSKGYTESVVTYNTTGKPTITVEIPDVDDPERVFDLIGRPASLKITKKTTKNRLYRRQQALENVGVAPDTEKNNNTYVISLQFNAEGTKAFAAATKENVGKALDIYINNEKLMTVSVSSEISNGQAVIKQGNDQTKTGGYTYEEAYNLATRLQAGTFGVDMTVRETNIISPTLGTTAIRSSLIAGIVGIVLVMISWSRFTECSVLWRTWRFLPTSNLYCSCARFFRGYNSRSRVLRVSSSVSVWRSTRTLLSLSVSRTNTGRDFSAATICS